MTAVVSDVSAEFSELAERVVFLHCAAILGRLRCLGIAGGRSRCPSTEALLRWRRNVVFFLVSFIVVDEIVVVNNSASRCCLGGFLAAAA